MMDKKKFSELLPIFKVELELLGGHVNLASTKEASEIITSIAEDRNVKLAVKCNLPFEDEINLTEVFARKGMSLARVGDGERNIIETISKADMGLSGATLAIAETGTIVIVCRKDEDRLVTCLPQLHVAVVPSSVLVQRPTDTIPLLEETLRDPSPCTVSFVSGPSRTADIEMKQVLGVHGPHEVHVVMLSDK